MNVLIILIFSTLHGTNIREISEIAKGFLVFNTSGSPTDFTDEHRFLCGLGGLEFERVTQISQMTQIFLTYSVRFTQIICERMRLPL